MMTKTAGSISVIICAYTEKRWHELVAAVESVQRQTVAPKEIIVVIDRNPKLLWRVQEYIPGVVAIENNRAKGASGSRNSGAIIAQGEILAFLDDDAIAQPDWIERLALCYTGPEVIGVGGKIDPLWKTGRPSWFPQEFNWVIGCSYRGMPTAQVPTPVRNVIGANMSIRRDILLTVGGFRESFGNNKESGKAPRRSWLRHCAGDEETELCMRSTQHFPGGKWLYTTQAIVQHQVPEERTHLSYFLWRCYDEGLGKASLVKLHDTGSALSTERAYTFKVLPSGVARGVAKAFLQFDPAALLQAACIIGGLAMTTTGYLIGSMASRAANAGNANLITTRHSLPQQDSLVKEVGAMKQQGNDEKEYQATGSAV